ncbi:MAG: hypothetical protein ACM30H_05575 [Clostridia bacterium]
MIVTADSVTEPGEVAGRVLVAGSHGGRVAAHYAAVAGVRAVIFNDAGIGLDEAGILGLALLETIGMAAAAVDHRSARIGDGGDMLARGILSRVNRVAGRLGLAPGMRCADAALRLAAAPQPEGRLPEEEQGRYRFADRVLGVDSIGMLEAEDAGRILVIGSHAALHGGRPESALPFGAALAIFNDAGGATSRLPELDRRGIAAAAVDCWSARIGDARSMWERGCLSQINASAAAQGIVAGSSVQAAAAVAAAREQP